MKQTDMIAWLENEGYMSVRLLPSGEIAAILPFLFTWGLIVGLDRAGYRTRFCFDTKNEAEASLQKWDGNGFPPGFWIKEKGEGGDRPNPNR